MCELPAMRGVTDRMLCLLDPNRRPRVPGRSTGLGFSTFMPLLKEYSHCGYNCKAAELLHRLHTTLRSATLNDAGH
eukprot:6465740-Amphidinium_carterae.1